MTKNIWGSDGWSGGYVPQPRERVLAVLPDGHEIEAEYRYPTARYTQWVPSFYSDEQIEADLSVPRPSLLEDATHICEHGNIHCQCPVTLWIEAQDRLARCVPSLLARAQQAEAERDDALGKVSAIDGGFDVYRRQTQRMESRLRAELAEAKAEAVELRRQLLDETYRPEGGEIVMRELVEAKAEAVERLRQFNAAKDQRDAALADADRLRAEVAEAKAENDELHQLIWKQGQLLTGAVNALRGEPPALTTWSHHDVAERARQVVAERDRLAAQVAAVRLTLASMEAYGLPASVVTPQEALIWAVAVVRNALGGAEQDEAKRGPKVIARRDAKGSTHAADCPCPTCARPTEGDEQ